MDEFTKERIIEELKASTQNASGMFEISEDTICNLMSLLTYAAPQLPQPAVPECYQRLLKHAYGMTMGHDWNKGTMAGHHREKLCKAVEDCRAAMLQGAEPVQNESPAQHWYLVSWRTAAGNFGHGDVNLDKPWSCGSARIAAGLIAETYPELQGQTVIIQSVMRIQPSECPPKQDESAQYPIICRSDERLMETPDITGETVKLIGSFNDDGFCHKHPMTAMRVHPLMQTASYPPQPVMYCPECEPRVAEWAERDKKLRNGKGV
ncbi:hypothetical protein [Leclercia adecarboxylata]|uniref:hypothetical protein n=1 Tax=Leclercia adecarboxylata TaxID=83655 RepID=UPI001CEF9C25|nr:hypothetical protein [Leclercia adecarboxylata]